MAPRFIGRAREIALLALYVIIITYYRPTPPKDRLRWWGHLAAVVIAWAIVVGLVVLLSRKR